MPPLRPSISHVTHLELQNTHIDSKSLHEYIRRFPRLQSLLYSHVGSEETLLTDFDPLLIKSALLFCAANTLEALHIHANYVQRGPHFVSSLKDFAVLTELSIEWAVLFARFYITRGLLSWLLPLS